MDMRITKMMMILLLLYVINGHHASSDWLHHRQAIAHGGGAGGHGGHGGGGGGHGAGGGGHPGAVIPAHAAGGQQAHGRKNDGSLRTASLFRLASTMLGLVVLLCFS
ncbi:hypothetical protein L2E82_28634 [Cichorium intybus]|uniref:Uncharacterized protein n=1 Tax=Cichorium intybus TaxID=13427 RepID=A0ACB9CWY0_CICIN|nr:hypothetical protein L2E82_28634 [Cichorium intybus]